MKNIYVIISLILIFFMLLLPLLSLKKAEGPSGEQGSVTVSGELEQKNAQISVYISESGKIEKMDVGEYIFGVVAAEMPALYNEEALKAQAVAAYTYALYRAETNKDKEYDITDSPSSDQCFITAEKAREKWGEKAAEYEEKIMGAVSAVAGEYLSYNGKPALALYHAISGGKTENSSSVFGQELPYLVSKESIGDLTANGYSSSAEFTITEFKERLKESVSFSKSEGEWIEAVNKSENGYVKSVSICGKSLSGVEIRELFALRSANFDLEYKNEKFVFSVRGYGHGVGMSQAGANFMAAQGNTYKEILLWYYSGCEISK